MRDTLYIQLGSGADDAPVAYTLTSGTPGVGIQTEQGTLDHVLGLAAGRRVVVFVPGAAVRLASVQVPASQPDKILQAAPYALEDQLAEDVDTLHFALAPAAGRPRANEPHAVAIVARERMERWLAPLRARNIKPDAVVPETLSLPLPEAGRWTALADAGGVTVRTGPFAGFSCTLADFEPYLQLADPEGQTALRLFVSREVDYDFTRLSRAIELLPGSRSALEVLVQHWRPETSINLLQGAYSETEHWQKLGRPWRIAAALAVAWVAAALIDQGVHTFQAGRELHRQEQANAARYQALFPGATRLDNLGLLVQQQLMAQRGGGARAPLFQLLEALSASLSATQGLTLQSMQFREGALFLNLKGTDLQSLENLRTWYKSRPGTVLSVQDTNATPEGVQIRLKLAPA